MDAKPGWNDAALRLPRWLQLTYYPPDSETVGQLSPTREPQASSPGAAGAYVAWGRWISFAEEPQPARHRCSGPIPGFLHKQQG